MANEPNPIGPPRVAHQMQSWAGPLPQRGTLPPRPPTMIYPDVLRGRPKLAHQFPFFFPRPIPVISLFPAYGAAPSATFFLALEDGVKITFGWSTAVFPSYSGLEQRESMLRMPRRQIAGNAFMTDSLSRSARGVLMRFAATGATFLMALPFEGISLVADTAGTIVNVATTAIADWIVPGQRVVVVSPAGVSVAVFAVVQSSTSTTITLDVTPGSAGVRGSVIMPLVHVVFDPQQGFSRYQTAVDLWSIRAQAVIFGYAGTENMGRGALVTTFTDGQNVAAEILTDTDLLVWDRTNLIDGTAPEAALSGAENIDMGALVTGIGSYTAPVWQRSVKFRSSSRAQWAWLKAFLRHVRGRQVAWLLPTNRPDLAFVAIISGGIKVQSASSGGGDYVSWFASTADRRLAIAVASVVGYYEVQSVTDNLDGTLSLALDVSVPGTPTKISFLEQVRFARDEIEVVWKGTQFELSETVVSVRDTVEVSSRFVYDRIVTLSFAYSGIPPDLPPTTQPLSIPAGGHTYLINVTSDRTLGFGGIIIAAGTVEATDGMVVTIENNNTAAFSASCNHEDTGITPAVRRFHNAGLIAAGGTGKSITYRYYGTQQRWIQILG